MKTALIPAIRVVRGTLCLVLLAPRDHVLGEHDFDVVTVTRTPAGMPLTVNANAGNDQFSVGNGDIDADLLGPVVINGGAGSNTATIFNTFDTTLETQTLNGATFIDGLSHTFNSLNKLTIHEGPGGTNLAINAAAQQTDVNGGAGNDTFDVGGGDLDANIPAGTSTAPSIFIDAKGGDDSIYINDLNNTSLFPYFFERPGGIDQLRKRNAALDHIVSWSGIEAVTLDASNGATPSGSFTGIQVTDIVAPVRINGNAGNDVVYIRDAAAPVYVHTGLGNADQLRVNSDFGAGDAPVTVVIDQSDDVESLEIRDGGAVRMENGATMLKTRIAQIPGTLIIAGVLDIAGGAFLSRTGGPTPSVFKTLISRGFNGGAWNGTNTSTAGAINSSLAAASPLSDAIGYALGSEIGMSTISSFTINPGDTLLRYTLGGDSVDLDVDLSDLGNLATNFGATSGSHWNDGNFDYDNDVDLPDLGALATSFGTSVCGEALVAAAGSLSRRRVRGSLN